MRYSLEAKYRKYVQGDGFLSFARRFGDKYGEKTNVYCNKNRNKCCKKFGDKYGKNLMDAGKKSGIDAAKIASIRVVQKIAEATGDLIGNKIADKITSLDKSKNKEKEKKYEIKETYDIEEIYIPPEKGQQIINDLRLF